MYLAKVVFSTSSSSIDSIRSFYVGKCLLEEIDAMTFRPVGNSRSAAIAFEDDDEVKLRKEIGGRSVYWKIGLTVGDVDAFGSKFSVVGSQFMDIGYLAHVQDPDRNAIELLQIDAPQQKSPCAVGQISLRVADIEKSVAFYTNLGMKTIAIMPVKTYGFTLYFLAYGGDDTPPNPQDLEALENRQWCYSRPYTTLELLHYHQPTELAPPSSSFRYLQVVLPEGQFRRILLQHDQPEGNSFFVRDPDGVLIRIDQSSNP